MKKTTSKSIKSPAPATKAASAAKPAPAAKSVKAPVKQRASVPAVKPVTAKKIATTITAQIDIGFGNLLHIRGEGPGLSWDRGLLMDCVADNQWKIVLGESVRPIVFKFLVNDLTWSAGEDYTVDPGASVTLTPTF